MKGFQGLWDLYCFSTTFCVFCERRWLRRNPKNAERRRANHRALHSQKMVYSLIIISLFSIWFGYGIWKSVFVDFCSVLLQIDWLLPRITLPFRLTSVIWMKAVFTMVNFPLSLFAASLAHRSLIIFFNYLDLYFDIPIMFSLGYFNYL